MTRLADQAARDTIETVFDRNLVVEAAAGTGKTTMLVKRIVSLLVAGEVEVQKIVAVTFTEKAAGELKLRIREELEKKRDGEEEVRRHLALSRLEEARVGTIHGFCADLLRERSVEAGIDPHFQTLDEAQGERVFDQAFDLWLQEKLDDPPEGLRRALRRKSNWGDDPVDRIRRAARELAEWRDFETPWERRAFDREVRVDQLLHSLTEFAEKSDNCHNPKGDNFFKDTEVARRVHHEIASAETVRDRDYDGTEAALINLDDWKFQRPRKGYGKQYGTKLPREEIHALHTRLVKELEDFHRDADADLASLLHAELREAVDRYEELKERTGSLDFVDLLLRTRDLVRDQRSVRADFQSRIDRIFIDEFQDTDPLQAEILLLLAADDPDQDDWRSIQPVPGKLFLVGDPKQSIYRFRRADVGTYLAVKQQLEAQGAECLQLTTSFRAVPDIQGAINVAFRNQMTGDETALQADYVPLTPYREGYDDQPAVVSLPVPAPYGYRDLYQAKMSESLADATAAYVEWLLHESGWTVTERGGTERVPLQPRHICLLFRRFEHFGSDVTKPYWQSLEARGIRHLMVGGRSFHEREEVETLRTALTAIEWPDDELALFATLRGSLFALGDAELLEFRHRFHRIHPFRIPDGELPERLQPIAEALELLKTLHRSRNHRPVAETVSRLLQETRAHAAFVMRPSGEQVLANVLYVAEQARAYEASGGISFRGFVDRLNQEAGKRRTQEAPILEERSEGVRIMTVHKAKGLEFPVVILADMTAKMARGNPGRHIDPERGLCAMRMGGWAPWELLEKQEEELAKDVAEGVRIAYVAATRARDLLVVPGIGDQRWGEGEVHTPRNPLAWLAPLNDAIYPLELAWRNAEPGVGCPEFGADTTVERPPERAFDAGGLKPGAHAIDQHTVVWWDPHLLKLNVDPQFGIRKSDLLHKDADPDAVKADQERFQTWRRERRELLDRATTPSLVVQTATERAKNKAGEPGVEVELIELDRTAARPGGARFGTLIHAALATVPLDADDAAVRRAVELQARIFGANGGEAMAAQMLVAQVLAHELFQRVRGADEVRRETPVTSMGEDEVLVEGVVDLAFREGDTWTVVDFKTDADLTEELPVYRKQVGIYAASIREATGQEARGVLLRI